MRLAGFFASVARILRGFFFRSCVTSSMSDWTPTLIIPDCPATEREVVFQLERLLSSLDGFARDFRAALALFDHADAGGGDDPDIRLRWQLLAAKDGAMTISISDGPSKTSAQRHLEIVQP